jgi:hypothetical protein
MLFPYLLLLRFKSVFKSGQPGLDAAVINITADFDAHAADQRRVPRTRCLAFGPYSRSRSDDTLVCKSAGKGVALSTVAVCRAQSSFTKRRKMRQKGETPTLLGFEDSPNNLANAILIQRSIDRHNRYRCFASLSSCLIVFISAFLP